MAEIIFVAITLAVLAIIAAHLVVKEKRRHSLFPDDGIVWNTAIEKRLRKEG